MTRHGSVVLAIAAAIVVTGCSSGADVVVRPPTDTPPRASSTPASSPPGSRPPARHPQLTITPSHGLRDGQQVTVSGRGFSAGEALQVVQCADKGQRTGAGDCNLPAMLPATSDADGRVRVTIKVARGPFGANNVVCGPKQRCLISVTQASLTPTEEADAEITFGT